LAHAATKTKRNRYAVVSHQPNLFIYLGDNIYGDTRNMGELQAKYRKLEAKPEFQRLRNATEVLATWDDHDYGENDAGRHYPFKRESKEIFLKFWNEPAHSERRNHEGIYHSLLYGPEAKRVQVILLDTRTFRDNLVEHKDKDGYKNDYRPNTIADSTMLGAAQWAWLETQFKVPAAIRIIASSTQFGHEYNGWESWTNVPHEQQKMLALIKKTKANDIVFISGDVHWGEISKMEVNDQYPIYDITSSGITQTWDKPEPNQNRIGEVVMQNNFGLIEIDWGSNTYKLTFKLIDIKNKIRARHEVKSDEITF